MSAAPAALAGLGERKGRIAARVRCRSRGLGSRRGVYRRPGAAAAAPQADAVCRPLAVRRRCITTFVRGERVWDKNRLAARVRRTAAMSASFLELVDLASERLGAAVVAANDEFFAPKENLIRAAAPVWREGEYTERGKWMDGWETRRRRDLAPDAHDWCIVRLGAPGIVRGVDVDTAFFTGNYPESCAIDACDLPGIAGRRRAGCGAPWREILPRTAAEGRRAQPDRRSTAAAPATHLRLRIYPGRRRRAAARARRGGRRLGAAAPPAATSTWPRSSTAASSSPAATCSTDRATT